MFGLFLNSHIFHDGVVAKQRNNSEVLCLTEVLDHDLHINRCHDLSGGSGTIRQCDADIIGLTGGGKAMSLYEIF